MDLETSVQRNNRPGRQRGPDLQQENKISSVTDTRSRVSLVEGLIGRVYGPKGIRVVLLLPYRIMSAKTFLLRD